MGKLNYTTAEINAKLSEKVDYAQKYISSMGLIKGQLMRGWIPLMAVPGLVYKVPEIGLFGTFWKVPLRMRLPVDEYSRFNLKELIPESTDFRFEGDISWGERTGTYDPDSGVLEVGPVLDPNKPRGDFYIGLRALFDVKRNEPVYITKKADGRFVRVNQPTLSLYGTKDWSLNICGQFISGRRRVSFSESFVGEGYKNSALYKDICDFIENIYPKGSVYVYKVAYRSMNNGGSNVPNYYRWKKVFNYKNRRMSGDLTLHGAANLLMHSGLIRIKPSPLHKEKCFRFYYDSCNSRIIVYEFPKGLNFNRRYIRKF